MFSMFFVVACAAMGKAHLVLKRNGGEPVGFSVDFCRGIAAGSGFVCSPRRAPAPPVLTGPIGSRSCG
jgi:hypothetical protein